MNAILNLIKAYPIPASVVAILVAVLLFLVWPIVKLVIYAGMAIALVGVVYWAVSLVRKG